MPASLWTSVLLGVALGAANAAASLLLARAARGRSQRAFMKLVFGGMVVRLTLLLAAFAAVVALFDVHRGGFVGALGATFVLGLGAEVLLVPRWTAGRPAPSA